MKCQSIPATSLSNIMLNILSLSLDENLITSRDLQRHFDLYKLVFYMHMDS